MSIVFRCPKCNALIFCALIMGCGNSKPSASAVFDPNDIEATKEWAKVRAMPLWTPWDNQIQRENYEKKLTEELRSHVGKEVRWKMKVNYVHNGLVVLEDHWTATNGDKEPSDSSGRTRIYRRYLVITHQDPGSDEMGREGLRIGPEISRERAATLHAGDHFAVTGRIKVCKTHWMGGNRTTTIEIRLEGARAEPF